MSAAGARALEIRGKLASLSRLGIGARILDLYGATLEDLELIAVIEDHVSKPPPTGGVPDEGC